MNSNWSIVAIAVIAALVGGVGGASLMNSRTAQAGANPAVTSSLSTAPAPPALTNEQIDRVARIAAMTAVETAREESAIQTGSIARGSSARTGRAPRRVYYDYAAPSGGQPAAAYLPQQKRSFWSRHRDLLTVGIGTALGTAIGAGAGGKKGALIGAGVGAGGSALYTYGLRDRSNRYNR